MEYNADCTGENTVKSQEHWALNVVDDMSVEEYRKAAVDAVQKLSVDVGIPTKLEALKEEDLQFLAESAHADACAPGNPKDASVEDPERASLESLCKLISGTRTKILKCDKL